MKMKYTVSLYIPTLNSEKYLPVLLEVILRDAKIIKEIFIIDGGSQDKTIEIAQKYGVTIIQNPKQHVAAARKLAVEISSAEILISIDSDCLPDRNWITRILEHFNDNDLTGVGGPYILSNPTTFVEEFSSNVFNCIMQFPDSKIQLDSIRMSGVFPEGSCAFRKDALVKIGNYNEIFTNHAEGVDIVWRLVNKKHKILFDPELRVEHLGYPKTIKQLVKRNYHYGWSSTKLAKYTLNRKSVDWGMYKKLIYQFPRLILFKRNAIISVVQIASFIIGKAVSSLVLRHRNL